MNPILPTPPLQPQPLTAEDIRRIIREELRAVGLAPKNGMIAIACRTGTQYIPSGNVVPMITVNGVLMTLEEFDKTLYR